MCEYTIIKMVGIHLVFFLDFTENMLKTYSNCAGEMQEHS